MASCRVLFLLQVVLGMCVCVSMSSKEYQTLDVISSIAGTASVFSDVKRSSRDPWSMEVLHRDALHGTPLTYEERLMERLRRDVARVKSLKIRMQQKKELVDNVQAEFSSPVVSGLLAGSGEYFVKIGVGTPAREQYMVIDTGSDVVWVQCQPCQKCYDQAYPIFNPTFSQSFSTIGCDSAVCSQLAQSQCGGGGCVYEVSYGDGSRTVGSFATETLTFGETTVNNVAIGCGHENDGLFVGAGGLLGLGAGALSFNSQLGNQTKGVFSYCLVERGSQSTGVMQFGPSATPVPSISVPMFSNKAWPSFYYVPLAGVLVGDSLISAPPSVLSEDVHGGVILDSGTAVTRLQADLYAGTRDAFLSGTAHLPRLSGGFSLFDTCYDLSGLVSVRVPTVRFYFSNGAVLTLPPTNYMVNVDSKGTFCFSFAPTDDGPSIIGNFQQQHIRVSFDSPNSLVAFSVNQYC